MIDEKKMATKGLRFKVQDSRQTSRRVAETAFMAGIFMIGSLIFSVLLHSQALAANTHLVIKGTPEISLNSPMGMAITRRGILYVVNTLRKKIMLFDSEGQFLTEFGEEGLGRGRLQIPWDIIINPLERVYVSDIGRHVILCFSLQGKFEFEFTNPRRKNEFLPMGMAWERCGILYVTDAAANQVCAFNAEGELKLTMGQEGNKEGELQQPVDIAVSEGKLFIVDSGNFRIQVFDKQGRYLHKFGAAGSGPGEFSLPKSIEIDSRGQIYISDIGNRKIQIFSKEFQYQSTIDKEDEKKFFFQSPINLLTYDQDLFVADSVQNQLIKFRRVSQYFGGCLGCHPKKRQEINKQYVHAPYLNNCEHCHQAHGEQKKLILLEKGDDLCMMCHTAMEENLFREHDNFPVTKISCLTCHHPHAADERRLLMVHKPVGEKQCQACHTVDPKTNKVTLTDPVPTLCYQCHESKQNNQIIHQPVAGGDCLGCHDVHNNKNRYCLQKREDALCEQCHTVSRKVHQGHNPYPSVTALSKKINRKIEAVAINKKGQALCINCHQPHCSNSRKLLRDRYVSCMGIGCHSSWP